MARFGVYPSYLFKDHDPVLDAIDTLIADRGETFAKIERASGVTATTLSNWRKRKTKRPQFATVKAVARALGADVIITDIPEATAADFKRARLVRKRR
jgi:transcriptional regulator with XRE-family HTH domain